MSSLLKNGDWLRQKSKIRWNEKQCEVPVPVFQQAVGGQSGRLDFRRHLTKCDFES